MKNMIIKGKYHSKDGDDEAGHFNSDKCIVEPGWVVIVQVAKDANKR
jgi:hypothetical protein